VPADGGIRFGNYVLLRRIARGGMAEVFLAQQRGLEGFDRRVAVKRILPHLADSPDFVKMFLGEAKLAAQLTHPNIVHIYDFGKVDHDYFIAMEYVEGVHAGELFKLREREWISPALIARIGADAAAALHYAHELRGPNGKPLGLVHRDVSPANLMISYDGVVKLCDFGIAKAAVLTDQRTNPGQVKGKYAYMSPEQTVASSLDGRSDVFSLAIVLWELLAGKSIVPRGDAIAAMRMIRDGKLAPIAQAAPGTPPQLVDAITWGLATRREDRATSAELATALEGFIKVSPDLATPMQVAAWLRARFPRESHTGPQRAIPSGTFAGPSTVGGTAGGGTLGGGTAVGTGTRVGAMTPPPPDDLDDMSETISFDPDAGAETLIVDEKLRPIPNRVTTIAPATAPREDPTLDDPALRATIAATARDRPSVIIHETLRAPVEPAGPPGSPRPFAAAPSSQPRPRGPSAPGAPGGLVGVGTSSGLRSAPAGIGTEAVSRVRPPRRLALFGVLAAIAVGSFLVALGVCSPAREAPDAAAITAAGDAPPPPPPPDAAAPDTPGADEPPPAADARLPFQVYKVDTRPPGGAVQIGDQRRVTPADFVLPPGKHTVVAELDGWQSETRSIEIFEGADLAQEIPFTRRIHIVRAPQIGTLTVRTTPYSDVYIGTRKLGQAPFADLEVPAGTYWLTFKNPRHPTVRKQVTIQPGRSFKLPPFNLPPPE
jgi:serine/threonine-protein kinase